MPSGEFLKCTKEPPTFLASQFLKSTKELSSILACGFYQLVSTTRKMTVCFQPECLAPIRDIDFIIPTLYATWGWAPGRERLGGS